MLGLTCVPSYRIGFGRPSQLAPALQVVRACIRPFSISIQFDFILLQAELEVEQLHVQLH